ncbi:MAG: nucleotide exchange factor GrpE [Nanoarchaeota archaeon]
MKHKQQEAQKKEPVVAEETSSDRQLEECRKLNETYLNDLKRLQADFENYKKRVEKENHEVKEFYNKEILFDLLTLMDDFDHIEVNLINSSKEDLEKTLQMLHSKLRKLLEHYKVRRFSSLNERFDPFKHEVLMQQDSDKENIVLEEFQKGYYFKDKILRHAKVKISKLKKGAEPDEQNPDEQKQQAG